MDELTNPTFRAELIDTIEELASGELAPDHTPVGSTFQIDVGLLLDEAEINRDLGGAIGNFLRNSDEAESSRGSQARCWPCSTREIEDSTTMLTWLRPLGKRYRGQLLRRSKF